MESEQNLDFEGDVSTQQVKMALRLEQAEAAATRTSDLPCLVVLGGGIAGEMFRIAGPRTVIGRSATAQVRIVDDDVSREHAQIVLHDGRAFVEDLGSKNGTYLNGTPIVGAQALRDGDKISLGSTMVLKFTYHDQAEEELQQRIYERARRDPLTGTFNRKYFEEQLLREYAYARRHGRSLALILFDVDRFKSINDSHGHPIGDLVLTAISSRLRPVLRAEDLFARYGGEEFVLLCRSTDADQARIAAERLRQTVASTPFTVRDLSIRLTMSAGVAMYPAAGITSPEELITAADQALYCAKRDGRDRVSVYDGRRA
jgi:diguanylate cyclase (GGDEF)-like protein